MVLVAIPAWSEGSFFCRLNAPRSVLPSLMRWSHALTMRALALLYFRMVRSVVHVWLLSMLRRRAFLHQAYKDVRRRYPFLRRVLASVTYSLELLGNVLVGSVTVHLFWRMAQAAVTVGQR
jgi:hypothetical protein